MEKLTQEIFMSRRTPYQIENYGYEEAIYINAKTKLKILCKVCGNCFYQLPHKHMAGQGCKRCKQKLGAADQTLTIEEFKRRAIEIWGDRYDYSKSVYVNSKTSIEIMCKIDGHGSFWKTPGDHTSRDKLQGCPKCSQEIQTDTMIPSLEEILESFAKVHGTTYDYSLVERAGRKSLINVVCRVPGHGIFTPSIGNHIQHGSGCPKCYTESISLRLRSTTEEFLSKVKERYPENNHDLSKVVYVDNNSKIIIVCPIHGEFTQTPGNYIVRGRCPGCSPKSVQEDDLYKFLISLGLKTDRGNRAIISPLELDFVIEDLKIAIEYDGIYFHSEKFSKNKNYHLNKTNRCKDNGYRLIHIFEDEWIHKTDIVKSRLMHIMGLSGKRLFARKLRVCPISIKESSEFLEATHIQGNVIGATSTYGLYDNVELVACMSFCKDRFSNSNSIELLRFSSKYSVIGGFSKLLKSFIRDNTDVKVIVSYSDKRWSEGQVYLKNGFRYLQSSSPGYDYVGTKNVRLSRQSFMKHKLSEKLAVYNSELTEEENCAINGYYRIWNCGMDKWVLEI